MRVAEFRELTVPGEAGGFCFGYWTMCLALHEPVVLGRVAVSVLGFRQSAFTSTATGSTIAIEYIAGQPPFNTTWTR